MAKLQTDDKQVSLRIECTRSISGYPSWMMHLLGAQEIAPGDINLSNRGLPRRLDTVEQAIDMLQNES